ncbi:MgtC/SapB family protein [Candidatus Woesearchaeota archaeon]|nr:MgtC/SapB family protein [Candidatus Woesearchaeota archaeon]
MHALIIILRILLTTIPSIIFGLERQKAHKPVGFGTFIFVSLGACAMGLVADSMGLENSVALLGATVTGIGFLGAGALIKGSDKVFGFTTASSIWLFAIFGLMIGIGELFISAIMYASVWIVFFIDQHLETKGVGSYQKKIILTTNKLVHEKELRQYLLLYTKKYKTMTFDINKKDNKITITYLIEGSRDSVNKIIKDLYKEPWFESCKIE